MLSVVVLAEISIDATTTLTEDNRKRKRGKGLQKMPNRSSSSGLQIPVTRIVHCVHDSLLAPAMASRFPQISLTVMVSPISVPDFASRTLQIVQPRKSLNKLRVVETNMYKG
ncbi:hypothetical protein Scep_007423 [Stephania cephalantha]|uniref:Uncharacterized protein n=1 Tax=Stephania cephalantha TaxID=152367 RepID=A0AAP0K9X7_9MAGN